MNEIVIKLALTAIYRSRESCRKECPLGFVWAFYSKDIYNVKHLLRQRDGSHATAHK